jgi:hypothetical protein
MTGGTPPAAAPRRRRATLGSPNFVALWGSTTASNLADGLFQVGLPLLALTLRVGGLALLTAAAALGVGSLPVLYLVAFAMGIAEVAAHTAAQALLPALVAREQLEGANAQLIGAQTIANAFAGPALGGAAGRDRGLAGAGRQRRPLRRRGGGAGPAAGLVPRGFGRAAAAPWCRDRRRAALPGAPPVAAHPGRGRVRHEPRLGELAGGAGGLRGSPRADGAVAVRVRPAVHRHRRRRRSWAGSGPRCGRCW